MNTKIREATINDVDKGLLSVFIEGYRYHQNGRPDVFTNISDEVLKEDLIKILFRAGTVWLRIPFSFSFGSSGFSEPVYFR